MLVPPRIIGQAVIYAALAAAAYFWHAGQVAEFKRDVLAEDQAARTRTALLLAEQNTELKGRLDESATIHANEKQVLADLVRRLAESDRLRDAEVAEFERKLADATQASTREFAAACDANFQRSRSHVVRFGQEAIGCSSAAHQVNRDATLIEDHWQRYLDTLKGTLK